MSEENSMDIDSTTQVMEAKTLLQRYNKANKVTKRKLGGAGMSRSLLFQVLTVVTSSFA